MLLVIAWFFKIVFMIWKVQSSKQSLTVKSWFFRFGRGSKNQLLPILVQSVVRSTKVRFCQCSGRTNVFHRQRQLPRPLRLDEQHVPWGRRQETAVTLWLPGQTLPRMVSRVVRWSEELFGKFSHSPKMWRYSESSIYVHSISVVSILSCYLNWSPNFDMHHKMPCIEYLFYLVLIMYVRHFPYIVDFGWN